MKQHVEIADMLARIEREVDGWDRGLLLMALEWAANQTPSTSQGLEEWLKERKESPLPVLNELADEYGMDTPFDYVSDRWGSEPGLMTPSEAIEMHRRLNWTDDDYSVMRLAHKPGQSVLEDENGNAILVIPEAHK